MRNNDALSKNDLLHNLLGNIAKVLLLNAYTIESPNLRQGKIGIAVTLFELSKYLSDETIENHAFYLFQESLTYNIAECNFDNGKAGIAYAIHYLIENKFIDADYMDLYGDKHVEITNDILTREYKKQEQSRYIGDLLFVNTMTNYLNKDDFCKCRDMVVDNICSAMKDFCQQITQPLVASYFYEYAAGILAVCNSTHFNKVHACKILHLIEEAQDMLNKRDIVCNSPSFSIQMYKYGALHNNDKFQEEGRGILEICMNNIVIPALKFRQKTNLILSLNELYTLDSSIDYRSMSNKIFDTLVDDDIRSLEQIIYNQIFKVSPFGIGVYEGVSRLALLLIYHEQLTTGVYPKHLFGLLN